MLTLRRSYGDANISILRNISKNVKQSKFYTVMADEVTDVSNHEQLVICIRWIDHNFEQHEDMIGFYQVEDIKSETSFKSIKNALNRMDIPLDFRRQYYDKSSNIVEARTGVVTRIKETLLWSRFTISCHWYRQSNKINERHSWRSIWTDWTYQIFSKKGKSFQQIEGRNGTRKLWLQNIMPDSFHCQSGIVTKRLR